MIVEQVIFGEVRGGHALRATSGDPVAVAELAPRLDLPDTAPSGVDWSPFVLGFPHQDRFVFARTFQDSEATRAGMVLSHALVVPLDDIVLAPDLRPLFDQLIGEANAPSELLTLNLELGKELPPATADLPAAAAALSKRATGPVVRIGNQGFDDLVVSLWGRLWPAMRRNFAFRLSFGPTDIVEAPQPILVCTPPGLVTRWRGHRLLDASDAKPASLAAGMLSGGSQGRALRTFADEIGADLTNFNDLPLLEHAYRVAVLEPDTIGNTVAAVRLVEGLSPDSTRGASRKADLLNRLVLHLKGATPDDVLLLRNLVLRGFAQAERLEAELNEFIMTNGFSEAQDASFRLVIADATDPSGSVESWRKAILGGLSGAARAQSQAFASAFWRWAEADPAIVQPLWKVIDPDKALESRLIDAAPRKLNREAAQPILKLAREQHFYRLHGVTASATYNPSDAIRVQVAVERPPGAEGVRLALRNATPREVVDCALIVVDPRVTSLAAEYVTEMPTLLADVDLSGEAARAVWSASLDKHLRAWRGPADPQAAFETILVDLLDGRPVAPELLYRLSLTPLADLTGFARRTELWAKLTGPTLDALIRATARGWLDKGAAGMPDSVLEPQLQKAVLNDRKLGELFDQFASGRIGVAVQIVAALPGFDQYRFRTWLREASSQTHPIPPGDSEAIGRLVRERRWKSVLDELMEMLRHGREDARPALCVCLSMINWLDRWRYGLSTISTAEKWTSLEVLAAELYPHGPDHDDLWERSGGHNADLRWKENGRARWREALSQIRLGGKGPRINKLLREMQRDYPSNQSLHFLANDHEFGGNR